MSRYKVEREIGAGAFGNVYLLRTRSRSEEQFALKTVNTLRLNINEEECCNEGTLMLKLCHNHLVHCYDAFMCSPHLYLIMELCLHGSLEQFLHGRKSLVPEKKICSWMSEMADVLRYLHALKIIHRDLKPANIFLDEKESIKLGDLGVARELDHTIQERHTAAGTLPYMSPEAFSGLPYNFKTDIWSLGCCFHEVMTLDKTFQGRSWTDLHHMITSAMIPEMPSAYQTKLKRLVLSLLNVDCHKRPDALEIQLFLFQIQGKQFSSEPSQPLNVISFDHKQIFLAVKAFEMSSKSDVILPLKGAGISGSSLTSQGSKLSQDVGTDDVSESSASHTGCHVESDSKGEEKSSDRLRQDSKWKTEGRPLPVPKLKKKNYLKKMTKLKTVNAVDDQSMVADIPVETSDNDREKSLYVSPVSQHSLVESHDDNSDANFANTSLSYSTSNTTVSSSSSQSNLSDDDEEESNLDTTQSNRDERWPEQYIDALTRDSIRWLRERFKPKDVHGQPSESKSTDGDNANDGDAAENSADDDKNGDDNNNSSDEDEATGLVTLFTQSQTVVYLNPKPPISAGAVKQSLPMSNGDGNNIISTSAIEAAKNVIKVFKGQDPQLLKLMLIKVLGVHGFLSHGQAMLRQSR